MAERSRWDLEEREVGLYLSRSFNYVVDFLRRMDGSEPYAHDPSGEEPLRAAKAVRRTALRRGGDEDAARASAVRHFGLPATALGFTAQLSEPLYAPARGSVS
jgi:hypothetical protein